MKNISKVILSATIASFKKYESDGARSTEKLKPLHEFAGSLLAQITEGRYELSHMSTKGGELTVPGAYYPKDVDIVLSHKKRPVFCLGIKFVTSNYKQNANNNNDATALLTSDDPPTNNNATLSPDNEVLLSTVFPQHSLMVKHFQKYATTKGFLLAEHTKQSFTTVEFANFFPGESIHSLGSNTIQTMTHARRVICVALPNLMAVPRVFNAVFLSRILGMPAIIISCYAQKDQTFPTIIGYCPN
jgi:hypothetical protein